MWLGKDPGSSIVKSESGWASTFPSTTLMSCFSVPIVTEITEVEVL